MRILLFVALMVSSLFSLTINESLLKVHATLVPKIYLMDYKFEEKLKNNTIKIAIIYEQNEYKDAKRLKNMIESKYRKGIKSYGVQAQLVNYRNIDTAEANIYYLFPTTTRKLTKVIKRADIYNALTFSYNRDDLRHGIMISLSVSKKIKPLLNLQAIKAHKISLRAVLINISNIYSMELSSIVHYKNRNSTFYKIFQV